MGKMKEDFTSGNLAVSRVGSFVTLIWLVFHDNTQFDENTFKWFQDISQDFSSDRILPTHFHCFLSRCYVGFACSSLVASLLETVEML